jgi:lipoate-protein ligase A
VSTHRLIIDPPAFGPWNMAVDEALLNDAADNGVATLRFYQWSEPTLSLGYFQRYDDRLRHDAILQCAVVRRQTGGGAILHDRELTYSLSLPATHPLARQNENLYAAVHEAFIAALTPKMGNCESRSVLKRRNQESSDSSRGDRFLCFQRRAPGDVVLLPSDANADPGSVPRPDQSSDWKVLGSAQRRHRGAVLQHGSLLLEKSPAAPQLAGLCDLTALPVDIQVVSGTVRVGIESCLNLRFLPTGLPPDLESKARELANNKYGAPAWTKRR